MKTLKTIFLLVIAASMFAACTADLDKLLVKQDGVWNVDKSTSEQYEDGVLIDSLTEVIENDGTITFNEDNTGSYVDGGGETGNFTWTFNADTEMLTITEDSISLPMAVLESSAKAQTLQAEFEFDFFGTTFKSVNTIELSR